MPVTTLLMGGHGIMDYRLHAIIIEVFPQLVAPIAKYWKYVKDIVGTVVFRRNGYKRITHIVNIQCGKSAAAFIINVKISQFDIKHGSLYLIETTVSTLVREDILS